MELFRNIALLLGRIVLGVVFIAHGWLKVDNGLTATTGFFESAGVPLPTLSAIFTIVVEIVGGAALIVGVFTRVVALLLVVPSLGAVFTAHWGSGFFAGDGGFEYVLSLAAFSLVVAAVGAGRFSLDAVLPDRLRKSPVIAG